MLDFVSITTGKWKECCYIVFDSHLHSIIIDPGDDFELVNSVITKNNLNVLAILCTHAHFDHIASVSKLKDAYQIPFYLHRGDFQLLKQANFYRHIFQGGQNMHNYKIGTTRLPGGDKEKLIRSIKKILSLHNPELQIFAGHGEPMLLSKAKKLIPIGYY